MNQTVWMRGAPLDVNGPAPDDNSAEGPGFVFGTDLFKEYFVEQDLSLTSPLISLVGTAYQTSSTPCIQDSLEYLKWVKTGSQ